MANKYGEKPPLSYNEYLCVQELIDLQRRRSTSHEHDELLFITVHQAYELWFKQILHEIDHAIKRIADVEVWPAVRALKRVVDIEKLLVNQIHILETMTPISFLQFREQLNPASGFQSMQFREIEFSSGLKDKNILREFINDDFAYKRLEARMLTPSLAERFYQLLEKRGLKAPFNPAETDPAKQKTAYEERTRAALEILTHYDKRHDEFELAEVLLEHDEYFSLWRSHHIKMVERMVGAKRGTGGSEGIGYLKTTLDKKFFPELWEARTYLDVSHGDVGCPFAH